MSKRERRSELKKEKIEEYESPIDQMIKEEKKSNPNFDFFEQETSVSREMALELSAKKIKYRME